MSIVDTSTGEIVEECTVDEARELTDRIKAAAEGLWSLLLEAHDRRAWKALGYRRWEDYVRGEFNMTRARSYQLLDQARVVHAIEGAAAMSNVFDTTAREVMDLKPILGEVLDEVRDRVEDLGSEPQPEQVQEVVTDVVRQKRRQVRAQRQQRTDVVGEIARALSYADHAARAADQIERAHLARRKAEAAAWRDGLSTSMQALQRLLNTLTEVSQ